MPLLEEIIEYSNDILEGRIVACQKHKWACSRFLKDLSRQGTEDFPYIFIEAKAERFFDWMRMFKHTKGVLAGQRIEPHIIQKFNFGNLYGWVHQETGRRRFKKSYWQVSRKNAKSQSEACVGTYETFAYGISASEVYCAATKRDQSKIVWDEARMMLEKCPEMKGKFKIAYGIIFHPRSESKMLTLSKEDGKTGDGFNPQCGIVDEYHAHPTSEIYDIIDSGMGARPESLMMIITTAGFDLNAPCYRVEYAYVVLILDPDSDVENDEYYVMINELDKDDDIKDESVWPKANPIVCSYPEGIEKLRSDLKIALDAPEKMRNFLTKRMNVWIDQKAGGYMLMDKWKACGVDEMPDTKGKECFVGIDLASKIDLASTGFEIPLEDGLYAVYSHSFIPEDTLVAKRKTDKVPYDLWLKQGWLTTTPGAVVDYNFIEQYIKDTAKENGWIIKELDFDPYNATQFAQNMQNEGYEAVEIRQGVKTLSEPTKNFRELVYARKILHNKNPVLYWALSNAVTRQDHNENIMLDKSKTVQRIDPIAAVINAHTRAMVVPVNKKSIYEERGVLSL
ncbi:MAG: terminase TerL endonuclease subunit [Carboxydocellales bacterium]